MKKVILLTLILSCTQGCALFNPEGAEFHATLGLRAVHQHQQSQATIANPCRGLKAYFTGCTETSSMEK